MNTGEKYIGSAKVGPKGQIVLPKDVREMFGINPGDTLIVLADINRGIAIERFDKFDKIADEIFAGKERQISLENTEDEELIFARAIKNIKKEGI